MPETDSAARPSRRRWLLAATGVCVLTAAVFLHRRPPLPQQGGEPADIQPGWTAAVNTDATTVFQRAFWRRPAADDHILHAERIEWSDPQNGVAKWQWFIALQPGADFKTWLTETNPFSLTLTDSFHAPPETRRPAWFPAAAASGEYEIRKGDTMFVLLCRQTGQLYATASGHGFSPPRTRDLPANPPARAHLGS